MKSPDKIASQMDQGNVVTATSEQYLKLVHAEYNLRKNGGQEAPSYRLSNNRFRRDPIREKYAIMIDTDLTLADLSQFPDEWHHHLPLRAWKGHCDREVLVDILGT